MPAGDQPCIVGTTSCSGRSLTLLEFLLAGNEMHTCPILLSRTLSVGCSVLPVGRGGRGRGCRATDNRNTFNLCTRKVALVDLLYSSASAQSLLGVFSGRGKQKCMSYSLVTHAVSNACWAVVEIEAVGN